MRLVLALVALLLSVATASAQIDSAPKVHARLIAKNGEIAPGGTVAVALEQNIRPGWHTYWKNPGEAGLPTELRWSLPPGWHAGAIQWPYPKRLPVGPLMNYGYEGKVWLLTSATAPRGAKPGETLTLKAAASWLVCKEVCIPEDQALTLPLTVSATPMPPYATVKQQFAAARAKIPVLSPWPVTFHLGGKLDLFIASPALAKTPPKDAAFFPLAEGEIAGFAPQTVSTADHGLVLQLQPVKKPKIGNTLSGVVVLTSSDGSVQALKVDAAPGAVPALQAGTATATPLVLAMLLALLGGLILNLMPCVLPVLAIKALAIANRARGDRREAATEGFAYGVGAILSFIAFGLAIVFLRAGGEAVGWGFQLQQPAAVAGFALLIFAVGLNLSGVFEIPGIGAGEALTRKGGAIGSFFTGVLAVAVAAPCTAPFMAAALGYALTQSAASALLVFLALGVGFALPFAVIGVSPGVDRWLPKPGVWMVRFKQFLAFPMYATAVWLLWVLSFETDPGHLIVVLLLAVAVAFALWIFGGTQGRGKSWRLAGWAALVICLAAIAEFLPPAGDGARASLQSGAAAVGVIPSRPYSAALLNKLRSQRRGVFVNATAAWCITCLVNEKVAFSSGAVRDAFARKHIAYLVADWTSRNPEITALLDAHGRSGVPLYLYYAPGAANPAVLPQILTAGEVLAAVRR